MFLIGRKSTILPIFLGKKNYCSQRDTSSIESDGNGILVIKTLSITCPRESENGYSQLKTIFTLVSLVIACCNQLSNLWCRWRMEEDTRSLTIVVTHTVFCSLSTLLALAGNLLVFLALYRNRRLRTITNLYVMSLAVADVIAATFLSPFRAIASGSRRWPFGYNFAQFAGFIRLVWVGVSVCSHVLTAVNRYFCVVKPQRYSIFFSRKKAILSIILVWLVMCVIS